MNHTSTFFLLILAALLIPGRALAQSGSIDASINLQDGLASCAFTTAGGDLDYGGLYKPVTGTNNVSIDPTSGALSLSGGGDASTFGTSQVGAFSLAGSNTSTFSVDIAYPASLTSGGNTLSYAGGWSQSTNAASGYSLVSGTTYNGTGPGLGTFSHFFRVGGDVSSIAGSTPNGTYTGTINVSAACN